MFGGAEGLAAGLPSASIPARSSGPLSNQTLPLFPAFSLHSFCVSPPQENDLNNMLNSLYDLPVPKPFTPVNLSVVGTHTLLTHYCRRRWTGVGRGIGGTRRGEGRMQKLSQSILKVERDTPKINWKKNGTKQRNNENLNTKDSDEEETKMAQKQAGGK